jgi:hypothetical protein
MFPHLYIPQRSNLIHEFESLSIHLTRIAYAAIKSHLVLLRKLGIALWGLFVYTRVSRMPWRLLQRHYYSALSIAGNLQSSLGIASGAKNAPSQ